MRKFISNLGIYIKPLTNRTNEVSGGLDHGLPPTSVINVDTFTVIRRLLLQRNPNSSEQQQTS
jgi:hypothetical protein